MMKKILLIIAVLCAGISLTMAQNIVKGIVLSGENGEPLPGATVSVTGASVTVLTDLNGQYSIEVPDGYKTLTVSYEGMEPVVVSINPEPIVLTPKTSLAVSWGVRLGMNVSKLRFSGDREYYGDEKSKAGFQVGVACHIAVSRQLPLFVESGLYMINKGGKQKEDDYEDKYKLWYLELPVVMSYHIDVQDFSIQPFFGVYYALGIGGKDKAKFDGEEKDYDVFGKENGEYNGLKRSDFGLRVGCGVEFSHLYLSLGYDAGLTNISQFDGEKCKTGSFLISLGYNF